MSPTPTPTSRKVPRAKDRALFWPVSHGGWPVSHGGTQVLLEACLRARVRQVVHTSSSAVYGAPDKNPVDERTPLRPGEDYGRAKLAAEAPAAGRRSVTQ